MKLKPITVWDHVTGPYHVTTAFNQAIFNAVREPVLADIWWGVLDQIRLAYRANQDET